MNFRVSEVERGGSDISRNYNIELFGTREVWEKRIKSFVRIAELMDDSPINKGKM